MVRVGLGWLYNYRGWDYREEAKRPICRFLVEIGI
jgi:hypothetical protein